MKERIFIERIPYLLTPLYEKAARMAMQSYYDPLAEEIVYCKDKGRILDLGTGPGYLPAAIAKMAPALKIDGIDLSPKLIRHAKANALRLGIAGRLNFQVGNAGKLQFRDASYDMVISTGMLHMLRNPVRVLNECYRVLRDSGEAWIYDPAQVSSRIDIDAWKVSLTLFERMVYRFFKIYTIFNPGHTYQQKEVEEMIAESDFTLYQIEEEGSEIKIKLKK